MAVLIPDKKCLILLIKKYFWLVQYASGYHLEPVASPSSPGASLNPVKIDLEEISSEFGNPRNLEECD